MAVVEEEVFGENIQFVVDLQQMHQDLLLQRRPARASMGSQELLGNAMASVLPASIACLRRPTARASEHQESNSHLPRGKGGWYLYLLLVCQVW